MKLRLFALALVCCVTLVTEGLGDEDVESALLNLFRRHEEQDNATTESPPPTPTFSSDCATKCPKHVKTPNCGDLKMAPNYDDGCKCLLEYKCCPKKCAPVDPSKCKNGTSFPEDTTDCCECPDVRCVPCPTVEMPNCNKECEKIEYQVLDNKCEIPKCVQSCPAIVNPVCPSCQMSEAYVNGSLCGCELQRCVPKPCPKKLSLPKKDCYDRGWQHDDCGCDVHRYVRSTYCNPYNKQALENECTDSKLPSHCFENVVREGKSSCGCDVGECVLLDEKVSNKFSTEICPTGYFYEEGLTPCGKDRDACLPCPAKKYTKNTCDPDCSDIVTRTDANNCTFQECRKKPCHNEGNCVVWMDVGIRDKCECNCFKGPEVAVVNREMWLVVQRRNHVGYWCHTGNNFCYNTPWAKYKNGFGDVSSTSNNVDYWRGLEEMHRLTKTGKWQLLMKWRWNSGSYTQRWAYVIYNDLKIESESNEYTLRLGAAVKYENVGSWNAMSCSDNKKFSTYDRRNGQSSGCHSSSSGSQSGGWWLCGCWHANFNGQHSYRLWLDSGRSWFNVLKTEMAIRPVV